MARHGVVVVALSALCCTGPVSLPAGAAPFARVQQPATAAAGAFSPQVLDELLAPVALYPDQLLAQMLLCAQQPDKVQEFSGWLVRNSELAGTKLQDAAKAAGYDASFVVIALFPQVVNFMADNIAWTRQLGDAFSKDQKGVFESIQRLRQRSQQAGNLKTTPQQKVETRTTKTGEQAIVIEPANPQVVYVPQYDPQVVYTQAAPTTTTIVIQEDDDDDEAVAAVAGAAVGFAAGIAIGAAMDNNYYYGPVRLARRRVHVQRRLGRLLRRPRGCPRGLLRQPRGRPGGHRRQPRGCPRERHRAAREHVEPAHRTRRDRTAAAHRTYREPPDARGAGAAAAAGRHGAHQRAGRRCRHRPVQRQRRVARYHDAIGRIAAAGVRMPSPGIRVAVPNARRHHAGPASRSSSRSSGGGRGGGGRRR